MTTCMAVSDNAIILARGLHIDHYDFQNHINVDISVPKPQENDAVTDIVISANGKYLGVITTSKQLLVYDLPLSAKYKSFVLPRSASKIRFTANNEQIIVADKSGDVLIYNIQNEDTGTKLLGHLSLLLDILQTNDGKFIITSDRDEKIRVTCYPNTYNIQTYCLGHKEFVNHIELLSHNDKYLTSTSGDGHVKCWNYAEGKVCYSIDTYLDVDEAHLKENFAKAMDAEGVEVNALPIVHYSITKLNETISIMAVAVHTFNKLLIYNLQTENDEFIHKLIEKLKLNRFPAAMTFHNLNLYVYDNIECNVSVYKVLHENENISIQFVNQIPFFENILLNSVKHVEHDSIKVLYKRKFDNVQEYQERKKQRLGKSVQDK